MSFKISVCIGASHVLPFRENVVLHVQVIVEVNTIMIVYVMLYCDINSNLHDFFRIFSKNLASLEWDVMR